LWFFFCVVSNYFCSIVRCLRRDQFQYDHLCNQYYRVREITYDIRISKVFEFSNFFRNFFVYKILFLAWSKVGGSIEITQSFLTLIAWVYNLKSQNLLYRIVLKNHNKRFGEFEFGYFGGSDVANKLKMKNEKNCQINLVQRLEEWQTV